MENYLSFSRATRETDMYFKIISMIDEFTKPFIMIGCEYASIRIDIEGAKVSTALFQEESEIFFEMYYDGINFIQNNAYIDFIVDLNALAKLTGALREISSTNGFDFGGKKNKPTFNNVFFLIGEFKASIKKDTIIYRIYEAVNCKIPKRIKEKIKSPTCNRYIAPTFLLNVKKLGLTTQFTVSPSDIVPHPNGYIGLQFKTENPILKEQIEFTYTVPAENPISYFEFLRLAAMSKSPVAVMLKTSMLSVGVPNGVFIATFAKPTLPRLIACSQTCIVRCNDVTKRDESKMVGEVEDIYEEAE